MRYEVKWTNGYWKLFDNKEWKEVAYYYTQRDALDNMEIANAI